MPITENLATATGVVGDLITADPTLTGSAKPNVLLTLTEGGQVLGTATADGSDAVQSSRGQPGRDDREFLEAIHYFTVHSITWRAHCAMNLATGTAYGSGSGD